MRRVIIWSTAAGLALFICVIAYQGYNYAVALGKATDDVLNSWAQLNDVQNAEVSRYRAECISIPASAKESKVPVRLESNTECAARIGAAALGSEIEIATDAVSVPAPLRWL
ncbi:hypothetical protein [Pseudomonas aeruginosa]|uniref:hypothetical protein n=1 Tax=Pseudomonas aeruginosa TaxID=287 RepID=UPI0034E0A5A8